MKTLLEPGFLLGVFFDFTCSNVWLPENYTAFDPMVGVGANAPLPYASQRICWRLLNPLAEQGTRDNQTRLFRPECPNKIPFPESKSRMRSRRSKGWFILVQSGRGGYGRSARKYSTSVSWRSSDCSWPYTIVSMTARGLFPGSEKVRECPAQK